jgi:hypothetical protein
VDIVVFWILWILWYFGYCGIVDIVDIVDVVVLWDCGIVDIVVLWIRENFLASAWNQTTGPLDVYRVRTTACFRLRRARSTHRDLTL